MIFRQQTVLALSLLAIAVIGIEEAGVKSLQPGYTSGMVPEVNGGWAGDEQFKDVNNNGTKTIYNYCDSLVFDPRGDPKPKNFLTFQSRFIENAVAGKPICSNIGFDTITGAVDGQNMIASNTVRQISESYILNINQKKCFTSSARDCPFNPTKAASGQFEDYEVMNKSCGSQLKTDALNGLQSCEVFNINLLQRANITDTDLPEKLIVAALSYGKQVDGFENVVCPSEPTADLNVLLDDPNMEGTLLFVKQSCIDTENKMFDCDYEAELEASDWECIVESEMI